MRMFRGRATAAVMAGLLAVGMAASPLAPVAAFAANEASAGSQTGSGQTDLTMVLRDTLEHGGTAEPEKNADGSDNPLYNPDSDGDGLGDNLAFTVPSSINYVVNADGSLIAPSEGAAYIENKSAFATHVSSMDVDPEAGFAFVADATQSNADNSVDLQVGPAADMLQASEYLDKKSVNNAIEWGMGTSENVPELVYSFESVPESGDVDWTSADASVQIVKQSMASILDQCAATGDWSCRASIFCVRRGNGYVQVYLEPTGENDADTYVDGVKVGHISIHTDPETGDSCVLRVQGMPEFYVSAPFVSTKLPLKSDGDVSHVTKDITEQTKFGTIKWYVTPGTVE